MADPLFNPVPSTFSRAINTLALLGICGVLGMAFFDQLVNNELPCPLCLLQRMAFMLIGMGLLLNIRFGPSPMHYGVILLSALVGAVASGRQVLLHLAPGDPGYGAPFLGMHYYTWAFLLFAATMVFVAVMLFIDRRANDQNQPIATNGFANFVMWLFFLLVLGNLASTLLECGIGQCDDNPTRYLWLS